jgi:outer membrane protein TolC
MIYFLLFTFLGFGVFANGTRMVMVKVGEAIELAISHHPKLRILKAKSDIAKLNIKDGYSMYLPTLDLIGQYGKSSLSDDKTNKTSKTTFSGYGLLANYLITDFGAREGKIDILKTQFLAQEYEKNAELQNLIFDITYKWYMVSLQKEDLGIKSKTYDLVQNEFSRVTEKYNRGLVKKLDYLKSKADLKLAKFNLIEADNKYQNNLYTLKTELGISDETHIINFQKDIVLSEKYKKDFSNISEVFKIAQENSLTLKIQETKLEETKLTKRVSTLLYMPKISAFAFHANIHSNSDPIALGGLGGLGLTGVNTIDLSGDRNITGGGLRVDFNLFNGFRDSNTIQKAIEAKSIQEDMLILTERQLRNAIFETYHNIKLAKEKIELADEIRTTTREYYNLMSQYYNQGIINFIDLANSRLDLEKSEDRLLQAKYFYNLQKLKLLNLISAL